MMEKLLMDTLIDIARKMLESNSTPLEQMQIEHAFIESLAFSTFDEILTLLDAVDEKYWLEFPVWARLISYNLICLRAPNNPSIKRRVAAGLLSFGPDWDLEAKKLQKEADLIESSQF
jgi:ABC-type uncharacterized transport system YnjBCD substrate-binding protein